MNINHINIINGEFAVSNTRNCFIHVENVNKRIKTLVTDSKVISPLLTEILITDNITAVSYNDIAQYDGWIFYIKNNNDNNACYFSTNLRKILKTDGTQVSGFSIPKDGIAKLRFDLTSGLFILEYLI